MPELNRSSGSAGAAKAGYESSQEAAGSAVDVTHLSTGSDAVAQLRAQLGGVPSVRQDRVDALKQAISDGSYQVSPSRIAQAMLSDAVAH
jgi:flagellar biosynthesis anti-sigma factor FlgM